MTVHTDRLKRNTQSCPQMFECSNLKQAGSIEEHICKWAFKWYSKQFQYQSCHPNIISTHLKRLNETYSAHKHQWTINYFRFKYNIGAFEKENATLIQNKSSFQVF